MQKEVILDNPGWRDVEAIIDEAKTSTLKLAMGSMLRINHLKEQSHAPTVNAPKVHKIQLMQEDDYLRRVLDLDEVDAKLKEWHSYKRPVYMIVTLLIADEVNYSEETKVKRTTAVGVEAPAELVPLAAAAGQTIPGPDSVNVAASLSTDRRLKAKHTAVGKRIFAIEYRVLTRKLLSISGKVDVRPQGVRGDGMFGHVEASMTTPEPEEQHSERIAEDEPLPVVVLEPKLMSIVSPWTMIDVLDMYLMLLRILSAHFYIGGEPLNFNPSIQLRYRTTLDTETMGRRDPRR
ncbi:MAG: hypothetical protein OHK93_004694 [Ramalina farinacea]|uniref:Uncharacterized protein n=1 Tax=Ramalina farinacea TaxID=258253 RepID=A0AA43QX16_9LECA|nr:hypothetical protein [Ramalina farinacea]